MNHFLHSILLLAHRLPSQHQTTKSQVLAEVTQAVRDELERNPYPNPESIAYQAIVAYETAKLREEKQ